MDLLHYGPVVDYLLGPVKGSHLPEYAHTVCLAEAINIFNLILDPLLPIISRYK